MHKNSLDLFLCQITGEHVQGQVSHVKSQEKSQEVLSRLLYIAWPYSQSLKTHFLVRGNFIGECTQTWKQYFIRSAVGLVVQPFFIDSYE